LKKTAITIITIIIVWALLAQTILCKNRWGNTKAYQVFKAKNIPLKIVDTIIDNHNMHYAISGNDSLPTLVFIHGSPGSWMNYMIYMWDTAMQKKFRMVSIDRPGFGHSNFGQALHLQNQCKIILPILQTLKTKHPMYICGHSMGGPVVAQLAAMDTNLFTTIVIAAGALDVALEEKENWRKVMNYKPLYYLLPGAFGPSNTELLYLKKDLVTSQTAFKNIKSNVVFLHGNKDTWVPIENIAYGIKQMANAKSIKAGTIFGAGHNIPWENREAFKKVLLGLY
jgi:pimeloyl-ACP methyl ester carboxylesterase